MLSKEVSSTIFKVFGMMRPGIEPRSPGPLGEHSTHWANEPVKQNIKDRYCYILTFWPGQKCHSKVMHRKEVTHSNGSYERKSRGRKLADEMGRVKKFPWYTHRLMHQKRVTCELHDSYSRLMTIKHSISKIEWAIELTLNYYIMQSRRKSSASWIAVELESEL